MRLDRDALLEAIVEIHSDVSCPLPPDLGSSYSFSHFYDLAERSKTIASLVQVGRELGLMSAKESDLFEHLSRLMAADYLKQGREL